MTTVGTCGSSGQVQIDSLGPGQGGTVTIVAQVDPSLTDSVIENPVTVTSDEATLDLDAATSASSIVLQQGGGPPTAVSSSPSSGTGNSSSFVFRFSDPAGYQNLGVVNVLINKSLDGQGACYVAYSVPASMLYLVDDAGDAGGPYAGMLVPGSAGTIQNSQCMVALVSAVGDGTTLTLTLNITFKAGFGGNWIIYTAARDGASGDSGWQALGVWQVPFTAGSISVMGTSPLRFTAASGSAYPLTVMLSDSKGTGDLGVINLLINSFVDGRHACYLAYSVPNNALYLVDDAGDAGGPFAGSVVLDGRPGSVANSQCSVTAAGSTAALSGNALTLTLNITFQSAFTGNRVVYVAGRDRSDRNTSGWQAMGTWTVQ